MLPTAARGLRYWGGMRRFWSSGSFRDWSLSMIASVALGVCLDIWPRKTLNSQGFGIKKRRARLRLINTHLCTFICHGACAFVLLLTAAYELEWSKDCGRMQLRSDMIDPIGRKRTPLLER
jgi:hypothetical protein